MTLCSKAKFTNLGSPTGVENCLEVFEIQNPYYHSKRA